MSRLETAKEKYPSISWEEAVKADPSKNHKYLDWIGANYNEKPDELKELLTQFEKKKDKLEEKDINKYTLSSLKEALEKLAPSRKEAKIAGSYEVGEVGKFKIVMLEGPAAVKAYTAKTRWCLSNMKTFISYAKGSNIFVIINTENSEKICLTISKVAKSIKFLNFYTSDDKNHYLNKNNSISKFLGIKDIILEPVFQKCLEYSSKHCNFWMTAAPKKDWKNYLDKIKQIGFNNEKEIYLLINKLGSIHTKSFLNFIAKNNPSYPNYVKVIKKSSATYYRGIYINNNYVGSEKYSTYYNSLFAAAKLKMTEKKKLLNSIKKKGGLSKLLENVNTRKQIEKLLKEIK